MAGKEMGPHILKQFPCLWNRNDPNFSNEVMKEACWQYLLKMYNKQSSAPADIESLKQWLSANGDVGDTERVPQPPQHYQTAPVVVGDAQEPLDLMDLALEFPCLWNVKDPNYKNYSMRERCKRKLLAKCNSQSTMYVITMSTVRRQLSTLCRKLKRRPKLLKAAIRKSSQLQASQDVPIVAATVPVTAANEPQHIINLSATSDPQHVLSPPGGLTAPPHPSVTGESLPLTPQDDTAGVSDGTPQVTTATETPLTIVPETASPQVDQNLIKKVTEKEKLQSNRRKKTNSRPLSEKARLFDLSNEFPCLWDPEHPHYHYNPIRDLSLELLLEKYNNYFPGKITLEELTKKMRDRASLQNRKKRSPKSNQGNTESATEKYAQSVSNSPTPLEISSDSDEPLSNYKNKKHMSREVSVITASDSDVTISDTEVTASDTEITDRTPNCATENTGTENTNETEENETRGQKTTNADKESEKTPQATFISLSEEFPCLWDPDHPHFGFGAVKTLSLKLLLIRYNKILTKKITLNELRKKMRGIAKKNAKEARNAKKLEDTQTSKERQKKSKNRSAEKCQNTTQKASQPQPEFTLFEISSDSDDPSIKKQGDPQKRQTTQVKVPGTEITAPNTEKNPDIDLTGPIMKMSAPNTNNTLPTTGVSVPNIVLTVPRTENIDPNRVIFVPNAGFIVPKPWEQRMSVPDIRIPDSSTGISVPATGVTVPNTGTTVPSIGIAVPNTGNAVPATVPDPEITVTNIRITVTNTAITVPNTGITAPNTGITVPKTGITVSKTGIKVPNTGITVPKTGITVPNTGITVPNTGITVPNTGITVPNTGITVPNTGITVPNTGITVPNTGITVPNTGITAPKTEITVPNTRTTVPNTRTTVPNTKTTFPNTRMTAPNTEVTTPNTNTIVPNKENTVQNTKIIDPDTGATIPDALISYNFCRLCGELKNDCTKFFEKNRPYLTKVGVDLHISDIWVAVNVQRPDRLPKTVCEDCDRRLCELYAFVKQAKDIQEAFNHLERKRRSKEVVNTDDTDESGGRKKVKITIDFNSDTLPFLSGDEDDCVEMNYTDDIETVETETCEVNFNDKIDSSTVHTETEDVAKENCDVIDMTVSDDDDVEVKPNIETPLLSNDTEIKNEIPDTSKEASVDISPQAQCVYDNTDVINFEENSNSVPSTEFANEVAKPDKCEVPVNIVAQSGGNGNMWVEVSPISVNHKDINEVSEPRNEIGDSPQSGKLDENNDNNSVTDTNIVNEVLRTNKSKVSVGIRSNSDIYSYKITGKDFAGICTDSQSTIVTLANKIKGNDFIDVFTDKDSHPASDKISEHTDLNSHTILEDVNSAVSKYRHLLLDSLSLDTGENCVDIKPDLSPPCNDDVVNNIIKSKLHSLNAKSSEIKRDKRIASVNVESQLSPSNIDDDENNDSESKIKLLYSAESAKETKQNNKCVDSDVKSHLPPSNNDDENKGDVSHTDEADSNDTDSYEKFIKGVLLQAINSAGIAIKNSGETEKSVNSVKNGMIVDVKKEIDDDVTDMEV